MPIPPKTPLQWACTECEWRHHLLIKSDVIIKPILECPKCGGSLALKPVPTNIFSKLKILFK